MPLASVKGFLFMGTPPCTPASINTIAHQCCAIPLMLRVPFPYPSPTKGVKVILVGNYETEAREEQEDE